MLSASESGLTCRKWPCHPRHCLFQSLCRATASCPCRALPTNGVDCFLGVPFSIASCALLTHMIAAVCDLEPGAFVHTLGDAHLYANHFEQAREQIGRTPTALPRLIIKIVPDNIDGFCYSDFEIVDDVAAPHIAVSYCGRQKATNQGSRNDRCACGDG